MMKSMNTLLVGVLSLQGVLARSAEQDQNGAIKPTTISAQNAEGGLRKLVDRGFLAVSKSSADGIPNQRLLTRSQGRTRGQRTAGQGNTRGKRIAGSGRSGKPTGGEKGEKNSKTRGDKKGDKKGDEKAKRSGSVGRNGGQQQTRGNRGGHAYEHPQMMDDPYYPTEPYYMDDQYKGDDYYYDDYYNGAPETKGRKKGGGKKDKDKKGESYGDDHYAMDDYYTDDYGYIEGPYYMDDPYYQGAPHNPSDPQMDDPFLMVDDGPIPDPEPPLPKWVPTNATAFQDSRFLATPTFVDSVFQDEFQAGTLYLFSDAGLLTSETLDESRPSGGVHGKCTRTDPYPQFDADYLGKAYCQFTYDLFDDSGTLVASFAAEGVVMNGPMSTLAITGGSGELRRVLGQVNLIPSFIDTSSRIPVAVADETLDFLGDVDGYQIEIFLWVDPSTIF